MDVLDFSAAILADALAVAVVAASLFRGLFRKYFNLNLYVMTLCAVDALRWVILHSYGLKSTEYFFAFFLGDALLAITAYLMILGFFDTLFRDTSLRPQIRLALFVFFLLVAGMSYVFISNTVDHFYSRLIVEFQQNMYFAQVVLTALLWVALAHLRVSGRQLNLLIAGLGMPAAALAAGYALQNLLPRELNLTLSELTRRFSTLATLAMLGLWCYALIKVPAGTAVPAPAPAQSGKLEPALAEAVSES